jgi:hypothetical protein
VFKFVAEAFEVELTFDSGYIFYDWPEGKQVPSRQEVRVRVWKTLTPEQVTAIQLALALSLAVGVAQHGGGGLGNPAECIM